MKLSKLYNSKNNSFSVLSIILSILIIYFHCYPLYYGATTNKVDFFSKLFIAENTGSIIVAMFFVISGFMITTSIKNSKNMAVYIKKRIVKIFPSLLFCLCISALVIVPFVLDIPIKNYYKTPSIYVNYIFDNLLLIKNTVYSILNAFQNNPYPYAINGSIWTLKHQVFMYIFMIIIYFIFIKRNKEYKYKNYFIIIFILTMNSYTGIYDNLFNYLSTNLNQIGLFMEFKLFIKLLYYFSAGVFINIYKDKIDYSKENIILGVLILILTMRTEIFQYSALILIPYFTVLLGSIKRKYTKKIIDASYQIYLWGFPIQQLIIYYSMKTNLNINFISYTILSILISIIVGYITYFFCEFLIKKGVTKCKNKIKY